MSYFEDLTRYSYAEGCEDAYNIGWLAHGHDFKVTDPGEDDLNKLWEICKVSIRQTRGLHGCDFCSSGFPIVAERHGARLLLGGAEIRVFSPAGVVYAAPTLLFHYMSIHHYCPPDEFLHALRYGDIPPSDRYFRWLRGVGLEWGATFEPSSLIQPFRLDQLPE